MAESKRIIERATALREEHQHSAATRARVKAVMNGGSEAIQALLGPHVKEEDLPWANIMLSGLTRLAQKIGDLPMVRVDPPEDNDSEAARKRAEKKQRIVVSYDLADRLELQLPQMGRWLPGYGFGVWTITARQADDGTPYPKAELRDPFDCYPSAWGVDQQPCELAVWRRISVDEAVRLFGDKVKGKLSRLADQGSMPAGMPSVWGSPLGAGGKWSNPAAHGLSLVEYWDKDGTWLVIPDIGEIVDFHENPLKSGPAFVVAKRFAFDQLAGQYDQVIGLMAAMAKINVLSIIAMEDAVFAETNIYGDGPIGGSYKRGRFATNKFPPGTRVEKVQNNLPYQLFEIVNRMERQMRLVAAYPVTDDAQSPMSFVTGQGLEELQSAVTNEVREYQKVLRWALQDLDAKRLEWDERVSPDRLKPMAGEIRGETFNEKYRPRTHIRGNYQTRRIYGMMSGWDDSAKIVGGLQLLSAGVIDLTTLRENIDGLTNITRIDERVSDERAREALFEALVFAAQQGDQRAVGALIAMLPESKLKRELQAHYMPEEPEVDPLLMEEDPLADLAGMAAPPDVATVLSRLTAAGAATGGVQTVGRV